MSWNVNISNHKSDIFLLTYMKTKYNKNIFVISRRRGLYKTVRRTFIVTKKKKKGKIFDTIINIMIYIFVSKLIAIKYLWWAYNKNDKLYVYMQSIYYLFYYFRLWKVSMYDIIISIYFYIVLVNRYYGRKF
jgi:hypothetical protein